MSGPGLPAPRPPFPVLVGLSKWAGPMAPAHGPPAPRPFLPAPMSPTPRVQHPVPPPSIPSECATIPEATSSPALAFEPAHPSAEPAQPAASPTHIALRPASPRPAPAPVSTARLQATAIIVTPPHPEGLARLQQQRERDGAPRAPLDKARGPSVVTPMPTAEELARLREVMNQRHAVKDECVSRDQRLTPSAGQPNADLSPAPVRAHSRY